MKKIKTTGVGQYIVCMSWINYDARLMPSEEFSYHKTGHLEMQMDEYYSLVPKVIGFKEL